MRCLSISTRLRGTVINMCVCCVYFVYLTSMCVFCDDVEPDKLTIIGDNVHEKSEKNEEKITGRTGFQTPESQLILYRRLFKQNHGMQVEAVKSLQKYTDYAKQYDMVKLMLNQIFKVIGQAQTNLTTAGYRPGDTFPTDDVTKQAMSKVLENTAMFGELVLRLPDIVHRQYDKRREWHILMSWSVWFCNESGVFDEADHKFLHLLSQEINLVEKDGTYVNPFTSDYQIKQQAAKAPQPQAPTPPKKKKTKTKSRGPRMSSRFQGEL